MKCALAAIAALHLLLPRPEAAGAEPAKGTGDGVLAQRLEWFQDQKFGLLIEFGIWASWGVTEAWPLSMDNYRANDHPGGWNFNFDVYRKAYWNLSKVFYPRHFDADEWAAIAKDAGMKYICFYAKHCDGFSMYDTKLSDFKVTSPECPYSDHPNPDITERLSTAFRQAGFGIGLAYCYADWHSPYYWKPGVPAPDRHYNYDIKQEPERWQKYLDFYMGQIGELMTGYGKIDILWLDAGWDKKDMQVEKMVKMARGHQPELIVVSRGGRVHEDIRTPERRVPEKPLGVPWETCESISDFWSFKPYDNYRSTRELIHMLVDIVSKGGNFLLSVPPMPDGRLTPPTLERLKEIGEWLRVNGEAIYGTRGYSQFREKNVCYTRKGNFAYAICLDTKEQPGEESGLSALVKTERVTRAGEDGQRSARVELAHSVRLKHVPPVPGSKVYLLGFPEPLAWEAVDQEIKITLPHTVVRTPPCRHAYAFRIQVAQ